LFSCAKSWNLDLHRWRCATRWPSYLWPDTLHGKLDDCLRNCSSRRWAWFKVSYYETGMPWCFVVVILTIRCWAVWGRDRRLTIGLPIFSFLTVAAVIVILVISLPTMKRGFTWLAVIHTLTSSFRRWSNAISTTPWLCYCFGLAYLVLWLGHLYGIWGRYVNSHRLHASGFWHWGEAFAFSWFSKGFKAVSLPCSGETKHLTSFIDKAGGYTGLFRVVYQDGILTLLTTRVTAYILVRYIVLRVSLWYVPLDGPPDTNWRYSNQCYHLLTWSSWTYELILFLVWNVLMTSGHIRSRLTAI